MMNRCSFTRLCLVLAVTALGGCAQFPDVDRAEAGSNAPGQQFAAPTLLPTETILDESRYAAPRAKSAGNRLEARAAALRQRAAALRRAKPEQ